MKFKCLFFILVSLFLLSCNSALYKDKPDSIGEQKKQPVQNIVLVEADAFVGVVQSLPNNSMRRETENKFSELNRKYNQSNKIPLTTIDVFFESLIERFPLQQHDRWLFELSKVYQRLALNKRALSVLDKIFLRYPDIEDQDELQYHRAQVLFDLRKFSQAEQAYRKVIAYRNSPYYEQAVYNQGWSQFKQNHYYRALNSFMHLLDVHSRGDDLVFQTMTPEDRKFVANVMQAINQCFENRAGPVSASQYFSGKKRRKYEYHIFLSLAEYYQKKNKITDAVKAYRLFVVSNDLHVQSPVFMRKIIDIYAAGGFDDELLSAKKDFVLQYHANHVYWSLYPVTETVESKLALIKNLKDLIVYYKNIKNDPHANRQVQRWSRVYLSMFMGSERFMSEDAGQVNLYLAEALQKNKLFEMAAIEYERVAYDYKYQKPPAEPAYNALIMYKKRLNEISGFAKKYWYKLFMDSAKRFVSAFPNHQKTPEIKLVLMKVVYDYDVEGSQYDLAFKLMGNREWDKSAAVFEKFRKNNSQQQLEIEITRKLALLHLGNDNYKKAVTELLQVSRFEDATNHQLDMLWLTAELAEISNDSKLAEKIYRHFIERFPFPLSRSVEAHQRLIEIYKRAGEFLRATQWQVKLVNVDANGGKQRTNRTRYLAAKARVFLIEPLLEKYRNANLYVPLNDSLKKKQEMMEEVLSAYRIIVSYNVPQIITYATYQIAELNMDLSQAIINAARPDDLTDAEQGQYDLLLKQKSLVFYQAAIKVHEINVLRLNDVKERALDDAWIRKSIVQLKLPGFEDG